MKILIGDQEDMDQRVESKIKEYLGMKGKKRLGVEDEITQNLLSRDIYPGIRLEFIESKKYNTWNEYNVLYKLNKIDSLSEFCYILSQFCSLLRNKLKDFPIKIGISDISTEEGNYYILIYVLREFEYKEEISEILEIFNEYDELHN